MNKFLILAGVSIFLLFFTIFFSLQNQMVYENTLGRISKNYERTGDWGNYQINQVKKPYENLNENNLTNWDAGIYHCLKENLYSFKNNCYSKVKSAFFPLFPIIWKSLRADSISIIIFNFFAWMFSSIILLNLLYKGKRIQKPILLLLALTLPSTVIFYLPYSEAVFMVTATISIYGIIKKKYFLYFLGIVLLAMIRPATAFVLLAVLIIEFVAFLQHFQFKLFILESFKKGIPFVLGYFLVFLIQYYYTSSWSSFLDATSYWQGEFQFPKSITDWSVEGFGLSSFSIFFLCIPAIIYTVSLFRINYLKYYFSFGELKTGEIQKKNYLLLISTLYLSGLLLFTFFYSEGNLHSFFRFTLASPFFYMLFFILAERLENESLIKKILFFTLKVSLFTAFLYLINYGGNRWRFEMTGAYLFIGAYLFYLILPHLKKSMRFTFISLIILLQTIWNTYLFNAFLSNSWIYT